MKSILARFSQHRGVVGTGLMVLAAALALSIGAMFRYQSGLLLLALGVIWSVGAGVLGYRLRNWLWPVLCPLAMLAIIMAWEVIYGRTSWASLYVFMLGVTFAVPATLGALLGTWLGRRRTTQSFAERTPDTSR